MYKVIKRLLDIIISLVILTLTAPLFIIVSAAIIITMGYPILFRQKRPGYNEDLFVLFKFRTMRNVYDGNGKLLTDHKRLTTLGRILRRTSIDELPQFINVIKGEMTIVGPRPLLAEYLPCYKKRERKRHLTKPGITGLAQVSGRNQLLWDDKLELDVQYVENQTLGLDLKIIVKTIWQVLSRKGILDQAIEGPLSEYRKNLNTNKEGEYE